MEDFAFLFWVAVGMLIVAGYWHGQRAAAQVNAALDSMPSTRWRALPGQVLALGDTGFEIRLEPASDKEHPYHLYSPEGAHLVKAGSGCLARLQLRGEELARERRVFEGAA